MGKRQNYYLIFILLSAVLIFQSEKCDGQFHWGKNHRLEAQKLKTMLSQMRPNNVMMTTNVSEDVIEDKDGEAVGYVFTLQNGTPRNNSYRGVLICALFRSVFPRCTRLVYPIFEQK